MADRKERFEMRQRGAGARDVDEFSLSIGGPSSDRAATPDDVSVQGGPVRVPIINDNEQRQQRFLMRQRGAGARDVDFSMNLGIQPTSSPTGRISVAGSTISSSSIALPVSQNATPRSGPSRLRQSFPAALIQTAASDEDGTATKRRRLSPVENEEPEEEGVFLEDDGSLQDMPEDDIIPDPTAGSTSSQLEGSTGSTGLTKKRRKKKSILVKPKRRKAANASSVDTSSVAEEDAEDNTITTVPLDSSRSGRQALTESTNTKQPIQRAPLPARKGDKDTTNKEDSVVMVNSKASETEESATRTGQSKVYSIFNKPTQPKSIATVPAIPRIQREHGLSNKENKPLDIARKPKTTASTTKKTSKTTAATFTRRKTTKSRKGQGSRRDPERNSKVVVTVRRVAHISRLDFITEEDDELAAEQLTTFRQKKSPNAVDVLAQICREIVDKRLKALNSEARNENRDQETTTTSSHKKKDNDLKRKREAVRRFGEELDSRLMMMTTALDHNASLQSTLKHATRQKTEHRSTLLALRNQRETIELQQDAIRAANEDAAKDANDRFEINSRLADIQLAVARGREDQDADGDVDGGRLGVNGSGKESLASRLQRLGEVVSSAQGRAGLLQRVRALNRLLEGVVRRGEL